MRIIMFTSMLFLVGLLTAPFAHAVGTDAQIGEEAKCPFKPSGRLTDHSQDLTPANAQAVQQSIRQAAVKTTDKANGF